ncbi:MAG TPA: DUF3332 family protein [Moraxellaceae bacterium]|nr:DUF3332 family protein [Moraxellaceae bacterium]
MKPSSLLKPLGVAITTVSLLCSSGCMGSFSLTHKIYNWNQHASGERWVNEMIFVVGLILPVYSLSLLADGIVFNSIQWWSGKNPVAAAGTQKRVIGADGSMAVMTMRADGGIDVMANSVDGDVAHFTLVRNGEKVTAVDSKGKALDMAAL